jgi:hypothetical protein
LNEKQYLQQMEQYKDDAQNAQNICTVRLKNTNKSISTICLLQNTNKLELAQNVEIICTRKRNQVQCLQIISDDLSQRKQNCTSGGN